MTAQSVHKRDPVDPAPSPETTLGVGRLRSPFSLIWGSVGFGLSVLLLFAFAVFAMFMLARTQQIEEAQLTTNLVEGSITRMLDSAESLIMTIAAAAEQVRTQGTEGQHTVEPIPDWETVETIANRSIRFSPYVRQLVVVSADGTVLADTLARTRGQRLDIGALELSEQPWRMYTSSSLFRRILIGKEIPGRFLPLTERTPPPSSRTIVPMALIAAPDIMVIAAINPSSLRRVLEHVHRDPVGSVALTALDGSPILSLSLDGRDAIAASNAPVAQAVASGAEQAIFTVPGGLSIIAMSTHFPFTVAAVLTDRDSALVWLNANSAILFWGFVAAIGLIVIGTLLLRETLRRLRLESRLSLLSLTEAVFAHSAEPMLIVDQNRRIQAANPAFLRATGSPIETVIAAPVARFLSSGPASDDDSDEPSDQQALPFWYLQSETGPPRATEYREAPLSSDTMILTLNDITDRIESEHALRAAAQRAELANRAKSEFLASMSHELRTPLNAILGFSEIIRDEVFGPVGSKQYLAYLQDILASGTHLRDIINDLLDLAKIEAGSFDLDPEVLNISDEIRTCCRLVNKRASDSHLDLTVDIGDDLPALYTDQQIFRQLMFNLLSNAIKFTPAGGSVTASAGCTPDVGFWVAVRDTGVGIAEQDQARIFDAYERAVNTNTRTIQGSGLGLALVKSMIELQGGSIHIESTVGEGSVFTLIFPNHLTRPN